MTSTVRSADGRVIVPARLRRRRAEVRRGRGRKRLHRLVAFAVVAGVVAAGWALLRSPLLAVDEVTVTGSDHVDADQVLRAAGIGPGTAMMDVSPSRVTDELEALPWVASATVTREWPGRVDIRLVDRTPVARVATGSGEVLVDTDGRVLDRSGGDDVALPLLVGPTPGEPGTQLRGSTPLLRTASSIPRTERDRITRVGFSDGDSVELTLRDGGVVALGRSEAFEAKFASLATMIEHLGGLAEGCTLDVSVPTAPTLTPEYGCA